MKSYKKLGKNILLLTIGSFASKVLTFLLVPFYTAILTTAEYGTSDLITTSVNLVLPVFTVLVYESVMRYALDNRDGKQVFSIGLYITIFGCIILTCFSPLLLLFKDIKNYIWLFVLYYSTLAIYNLVLQFVKGIEKVVIYSFAGVLNTLIYIGCNVLFLLVLDMRIEGYLLAAIIAHMVSAIFVFIVAKLYKVILPFKMINKNQGKEMLRYSAPMIPNAISWWISNSSDKYILTLFCGVAVTGIYSVAYKIPSILTMLVSIFISAWQISSVENFGSDESKKFYEDIYDKYESLLFLVAAFLIAFTKIFAELLFSNDFFEAWHFVPVLIYAFVFNSLASYYGSIYTAAKKTKMLFYSTIIGAGMNIVLNFSLIIPFGAQGAAIATAISYFVVWLVRLIDSKKILKFKVHWKRDLVAHCVLIVLIVCLCIDFNPYYIVSIVGTLIMCVICRKTIKEVCILVAKKMNIIKR